MLGGGLISAGTTWQASRPHVVIHVNRSRRLLVRHVGSIIGNESCFMTSKLRATLIGLLLHGLLLVCFSHLLSALCVAVGTIIPIRPPLLCLHSAQEGVFGSHVTSLPLTMLGALIRVGTTQMLMEEVVGRTDWTKRCEQTEGTETLPRGQGCYHHVFSTAAFC